jgi:hypothetical protein
MESLELAAKNGCHLCTLFGAKLKNYTEQPYRLRDGLSHTAVLIFYESSEHKIQDKRATIPFAKGTLHVACHGIGHGKLPVVEYPDSRCAFMTLLQSMADKDLLTKPIFTVVQSVLGDALIQFHHRLVS